MDDEYYKRTINGDTVLQIAFNKENYVLAKKIVEENHFLSQHCPVRSGSNTLVKTRNRLGETPLLFCAKINNTEMFHTLLENGALDTIDMSDKKECMPISYACYNNNLQMITALAKNNVALNTVTIADAMPIHIAMNNNNYSLAQHLLNLGADINAQDMHYENSPLLVATQDNNEQRIKWIISHGGDITRRNKAGADVLDIAIVKKYKNLLPLFGAHGSNIDHMDKYGRTRLMNVFAMGNNDMIESLIALGANINHKDKDGNTAIHVATEGHNLEGAKIALHHNKNLVHEKNKYGNTSLHWAADNEQSSAFVELYIAHNADVNVQNIYGEMPLHRATAVGNKKSIELLKKHKASLFLVTNKNDTLAHYALIYDKYDCLSLVLNTQTINIFNNNGQSALSLAIEKRCSLNVLQKIVDCGTNLVLLLPGKNGDSYVHHAILHHCHDVFMMPVFSSLLNKENNYRTTPLSYAVQQKNRQAVKILLEKRVQLNVADNNGWTEMHHAAAIDDDYIVDMLPFSAAAYAKRTNTGNTPLHVAAQYNRVNNIKKILSRDNNRSRKNDNGETPVMTAAFNGGLQAMHVLLQESDFIDETVEVMIRSISSAHIKFHLSSVQTYLEKELEKWNGECNAILALQNDIQKTVQINSTSSMLLKQKAIKEYACYARSYNPSPQPLSFSFEQLKTMSRAQRSEQRLLLQHILEKEQKVGEILRKNIESINTRQKEAEAKIEAKLQQITITTTTIVQPEVVADTQLAENECDLCNEMKKDAQRQCSCKECDKKICYACIKAWQEKGKSTCPYCFSELKK